MENTSEKQLRAKVRVFAHKPKKQWVGAYAWAKVTKANTSPPTFTVTETVDDEAEFVKGDKVYCIVDAKSELIATWKVMFVLLLAMFSCTPEQIQPLQRTYGTIWMVPNPYADPEYQLEFVSPGYREVAGQDTAYYRTTATKTNTETKTNVDTVFVWRVPTENFIKFQPN